MRNEICPATPLPRRLGFALTGCLALVFATVPAVHAGPTGHIYYWTGPGGNATWDLSNTLWHLDSVGGASTVFGGAGGASSAVFGVLGSAGTVTLGTSISASNISFGAAAYTVAFNGSNLTATSGLSITGATVFDFGGTSSSATFGGSNGITWSSTLTINNYVTNTSVLKFGATTLGLSGSQLSAIIFSGYTNGGAAQIDGSGFVTPTGVSAIPEPSTYAVILGALALGAAGVREHRRRKVERLDPKTLA